MAQQMNDDEKDVSELSTAEREEFGDAFKLFDKDGDGVITVDEIYTVLQDLGFKKYSKGDVTKMVKSVDADENGTIDLDEFIALLRSKDTGKYAKMTYEQVRFKPFQYTDLQIENVSNFQLLESIYHENIWIEIVQNQSKWFIFKPFQSSFKPLTLQIETIPIYGASD